MEKEIVHKILNNFKDKRVLVIGDSILDETHFLDVIGLSLETPTLKTREVKIERELGGAFNVAKNIVNLGAKCYFLTMLAKDSYVDYFNIEHPNFELLPVYGKSKNTIKKRYWINRGGHSYKHLQINISGDGEIPIEYHEMASYRFQSVLSQVDVVLLCDYRGGTINDTLLRVVKDRIKDRNILCIANSQMSDREQNYQLYEGLDIVSMNRDEIDSLCVDMKSNLENTIRNLNSDVVVTEGRGGSSLYLTNENNIQKFSSPSIKVQEIDSCGAGDCFLSAFSISDPLQNPIESLYLANVWAGLSVQYLGTKSPSLEELIKYVN